MNYHLRDDNSFLNFDSQLAKPHFWPKRGQWDPIGTQFDTIWTKVDPNWVKLGPNEAQSIFTNSRSTAQADVMLQIHINIWVPGLRKKKPKKASNT